MISPVLHFRTNSCCSERFLLLAIFGLTFTILRGVIGGCCNATTVFFSPQVGLTVKRAVQ